MYTPRGFKSNLIGLPTTFRSATLVHSHPLFPLPKKRKKEKKEKGNFFFFKPSAGSDTNTSTSYRNSPHYLLVPNASHLSILKTQFHLTSTPNRKRKKHKSKIPAYITPQ
jgi:hypothetical protein